MVALPALALSASLLDRDGSADEAATVAGLVRLVSDFATGVSWLLVMALALVSVVHYASAAVASRAAVGVPLPKTELVFAQLAASAANRLTPAGVGGAGLLGRFFHRRGAMPAVEATAAVTSLAALGGVADCIAFALLVGVGVAFGVPGAAAEVPQLLTRLVHLVPFVTNPTAVFGAAVAAMLGVGVLIVVQRVRGVHLLDRLVRGAKGFGAAVVGLVAHPYRLGALMGASALTTSVLAGGFALAAVLGPTHLAAGRAVPLMIGYMVAAAAGNAVPTPGGIGAVDAAFVGVLVAAQASSGAALSVVLLFRGITFWAPAVLGLVLAHRLRRAGAL